MIIIKCVSLPWWGKTWKLKYTSLIEFSCSETHLQCITSWQISSSIHWARYVVGSWGCQDAQNTSSQYLLLFIVHHSFGGLMASSVYVLVSNICWLDSASQSTSVWSALALLLLPQDMPSVSSQVFYTSLLTYHQICWSPSRGLLVT